MNHVADMQHHLEDNGAAERSSRLDCVDSPRSNFTDRENTNPLRCRDAAENSCTIKYRRYGWAHFFCV